MKHIELIHELIRLVVIQQQTTAYPVIQQVVSGERRMYADLTPILRGREVVTNRPFLHGI